MGNSIFSESLFSPCFEISNTIHTSVTAIQIQYQHDLEFHLKHSLIFTPKFDSFLYKNLFSLKMETGSYFLKPRNKFCTLPWAKKINQHSGSSLETLSALSLQLQL